MTEPAAHPDAFVVEGQVALPYQYFAGATSSRFIVALRDEKMILGLRSPSTGKVYVPPRQVDEKTFERLDAEENWVEVSSEGSVVGYTVVRYAEPYQPKEPPYVLALIKLDGADTPIAHIIDAPPEAMKVGMWVKAVFGEARRDNILEIAHFVPA